MEQSILSFAAQHGPWAAFCLVMFAACAWLVRYTLMTSSARETALQGIISRMTTSLESQATALTHITERLEAMDHSIERIERRLGS